ncbi:Topoisomerase 1-associated factor 1 [Spathaspora sp. JA1]|nr:Topoisomerase 1-associated factor 1 [Spathaspora sp. JA1]
MSSDTDNYEELGDFIVDEVEEVPVDQPPEEPEAPDRIRTLTTTLQPNQTPAEKLIQAHITVLCSALGGIDHTSSQTPQPYKLGHDALACLKDIKRWIRSVDERQHNFSVALACNECGLVKDLIMILCQYDKHVGMKIDKIKLACLELLVLLTWPTEFGVELSEQQRLLYSKLRKVQVGYKKLMLVKNGDVLKSVIRLVLPVIKKSRLDREPRENQILKLVLYLIRNVLAIVPVNSSISSKSTRAVVVGDDLPQGVSPDDISINNVVANFEKNKVFMFLLTISGSIGHEFDQEMFGEICLECIYLLVKGLSVEELTKSQDLTGSSTNSTTSVPASASTTGLELQDLLASETKRKQQQTNTISTRHGRFGSLLSIQAPDSNPYVVSGQQALFTTSSTLTNLDKSKKWKNRSYFKYDSDEYVISKYPVYLTNNGRTLLGKFIESFLIGGCFNNLIQSMSSKLSSLNDMNIIDEYTKASYFFTISWFLAYTKHSITTFENYGSVGAALSSVNFILLISYFRDSFGSKSWNSLHVAMICFQELIQISNSLFGTQEDSLDKELAEGIIRKLFTFSDFLSIIIQIPQTAARHSPAYLGVAISTVNTLLESFETFANEDVELYIQSKRKQKKAKQTSTDEGFDNDSEEETTHAREVIKERKLDFKHTEARFFHTSIVNAYIEYLSRYNDLTSPQIKTCFKYFHRLFVIRKDFTGLYRLDFMQLLNNLHQDLKGSIKIHVDEFIYYFMKKFKLAISRFPMPIELLFPRLEDLSSKIYLSTGEIYIKPDNTSSPRLAKSLEFSRDFTLDEKFKILICALKAQDKLPLINHIIAELTRILNQRTLDNSSIGELNPGSYARLFINNGNLRLLLKVMGFELSYTMEENPELPSSVDTSTLKEYIELIKKWRDQHGEFDDGKEPSFFLREAEDEQEDDFEYGYDDIAFETNPTGSGDRMNIHELDTLDELEQSLTGHARKKPRTKHRRHREPSSSQRQPRENSIRTYNSAEFVHDSDDESDDERNAEFFAREERLRNLLGESGGIVDAEQLKEFKLRWKEIEQVTKRTVNTGLFVQDDDEDDVMSDVLASSTDSSKRVSDDEDVVSSKRKRIIVSDDEEE